MFFQESKEAVVREQRSASGRHGLQCRGAGGGRREAR